MKRTRRILGSLAIIGGLIGSLSLVHAQMTASAVQSVSATQSAQEDSIVSAAAEAQGLELVPPDQIPRFGTFWVVSGEQPPVPFPFLPYDPASTPVFSLGTDGQFLVDGTADVGGASAAVLAAQANAVANLIDRVEVTEANRQMRAMGMDVPVPGDGGDGGTNTFTFNESGFTVDYGTNLWIAQVGISSGSLVGIVSNSAADVQLELQINSDLLSSNWSSAGFVYGSEVTNWTVWSVPMSSPSNLFLRVKSWADTQGVGIPDWWQLLYFHQIGIDPNADPDGDGLSNLQEFLLGTDPTVFNLPDAPGNFIAVLNTNGTDVALSWNPPLILPQNYALGRYDFNWSTFDWNFTSLGSVNGNATSFVDVGAVTGGAYGNSYYQIQAVYASGSTPIVTSRIYLSSPIPPTFAYNIPITARLVRNSTGRWQLMCSGLPAGAQTVLLTWTDSNGNPVSQNISTSNLTNGAYYVPDTDAVNHMGDSLSVQLLGLNGEPGQIAQAGVLAEDAPYFVDGRQHLKQNLIFLLRGATMHYPYLSGDYRFNSSSNLEECSFIHRDSGVVVLDNLWPFEVNYWLRNDVLDTNDPGPFQFTWLTNFTTIPAPPVLAHAEPYWISQGASPNRLADLGVTLSSADYTNYVSLQGSTFYNCYGLVAESGDGVNVQNAFNPFYGLPQSFPLDYQVIGLGDTVDWFITPLGNYYSQFQAPVLANVGYYFAPLINPNANTMGLPPVNQQPLPLPIDDTFKVTNQTPPLIVGAVGQPMILGGWAKYAISNSSPTKFAYLGQYFVTNAYLLDTNGTATTNTAGIVSPYGEFFPTQMGKAALVTMPDIDPPYQQATCVVQVVKLQLDGNHDGNMDLSFNGPDTTSPSQPYVFWVDNNYDRSAKDKDDNTYYEDDVKIASVPDCNYTDFFGSRIIPTKRDLEDYSRLWICGVTSNLLAALPPNSTVKLSWGDVENPNPNNPTIDLFTAADPDGGIGYLTNATIAAEQTNVFQCPYIQRLGPGQSVQLNANIFGSTWRGNYFIWCGVTNGSGSLTLTFKDGNGNVLGQSSVYIQLKDIKQMYERWSVGDNPSRAPASTAYPVQDTITTQGFEYPAPWNNNTPYIFYVHGWNLDIWEKDRFAETAFKRLYWQGYQGRFGMFRWPTSWGFTGDFSQLFNDQRMKDNFDNSEYSAWLAGTGLLNKLNDLNTQYPGHVYVLAHSMGNIVTGEALRLAGNNQVVNTYVASQAAVTAHTYDTNIANYSFTVTTDAGQFNFGPHTPNIYGNWFASNNGGGAGHVINFYNTNDYALSRLHWQLDQLFKPDQVVVTPSTVWTYRYNGNANDPAPWNHFYKTNLLAGGIVSFDIVNSLTNRYEVMAFAAQAYTTALGATPTTFHLTASIDLTRQSPQIWPPDNSTTDPTKKYAAHFWHSAEFRGDYSPMQGYWSELLGAEAFNLK